MGRHSQLGGVADVKSGFDKSPNAVTHELVAGLRKMDLTKFRIAADNDRKENTPGDQNDVVPGSDGTLYAAVLMKERRKGQFKHNDLTIDRARRDGSANRQGRLRIVLMLSSREYSQYGIAVDEITTAITPNLKRKNTDAAANRSRNHRCQWSDDQKPGGRITRPGGRFPNGWLVLNLRQNFCNGSAIDSQSPRNRPIRLPCRRKCLYCQCLCH